MYYCLRILA